ncbi:uncharacterized protein LOC123561865 [Mercenaria mercenaria]|uniref:uncharacterized protein LOC123561865 n=1 Tax=Mercenaria mercenaria TaxID=6596 RepID=UPI00234EDE42|nr:uncharacterized protein LOC123561865 [Mercenaria mercenaria]
MTTTMLVRSVCTSTNSVVNLIGSNFRIGALSFQPLRRCVATKSDVDDALKEYKEGKFDKLPDPDKLAHFRKTKPEVVIHDAEVPKQDVLPMGAAALPHPIWSEDELHKVEITHKPLEGFVDMAAFFNVKTVRRGFDVVSGFSRGERNEYKWLKKTKPEVVIHDVEVPKQDVLPMGAAALPHPIWSEDELHKVEITHKLPKGFVDMAAFFTVKTVRRGFDVVSGFSRGERNEYKWLTRIIFLETVAGVPGMVAAMTRHLHSLRRMQRDYGWIHTLLEEAENERMHLMTALQLKQPSRLFKWCVIGTQGVFVGMFSVWYLISPRFCHRFVGYLEEEAVKNYTECLEDIESGALEHWKTQPSPEVAITYWNLPEDATMKDVILAIRADEAHHRLVNHTLASMKPTDYNPYKPGK